MPRPTVKDREASITQQKEVNRIRELMLMGLRDHGGGGLQARETALAAITVAAECYLGQDKVATEMELHSMVTFVMRHIDIISDKEMN